MTAEICLVMPFWSQSDGMNWDSNYSYLKTVLPAVSKLLPDWLFVVAWPEAAYGADKWVWHGDSFFNERIVRYPWPYDTAMRSSVLGFDPMKFKELDFQVAPTIFWMHQVESIPFMVGGYKQSFSNRSKPIFVAQHHYVIHPSLPYPFETLFPRLWLQMGGSLSAHRVLLNSDYTLKLMMESFGQFLTADKMKELHAKSTVRRFGLISDETEIPIQKGPGKPVVVFNHRFEGYKQPFKTGEILSKLKAKYDFQIWITQMEGQRAKFFPVDKFVGDPVKRKYLENIAVPAINTMNSAHETFCISILDSLSLGHVVVVPNALTFPELVPKDYPFLFNSPKEQLVMLDHIISTWPLEYNKWSKKLRAHVKQHFALKPYAKDIATILENEANGWMISEPKQKTKDGFDRFFKGLKPGTYTMDDIRKVAHKATETGDQSVPSRRVVREWALRGGKFAWGKNSVLLVWKS